MWALRMRVAMLTKAPVSAREKDAGELCPPDWSEVRASYGASYLHADEDDVLDVEPAPSAAVPPCWGAYVSNATRSLAEESDPERIARALMALAERPHRAAIAVNLAERLRRLVKLEPSGDIDGRSIGGSSATDRARRAIIYAALLRTQRFGSSPATADVLFGKLAVMRDVTGGYGSTSATVAVLRALLTSQLDGHGATRAHVHSANRDGAVDRDVDVPESGFVAVPLPAGALAVSVHSTGPGLVARFERPVLASLDAPAASAREPRRGRGRLAGGRGLGHDRNAAPHGATLARRHARRRHACSSSAWRDARRARPRGLRRYRAY